MPTVLPLLRRGLAAGALAGLATGLFSLLLSEPLMDHAVRLEEQSREARSHRHGQGATAAVVHHHEELFSRGAQHFGLVVTTVVAGLALGALFGVVYALVNRRSDPGVGPWPRAMSLAGAGFVALSLLPGLRYPAVPPGVGDSGTVRDRQLLWLAAVAIGVLGVLLAWQVGRRLADRSAPRRHVAVACSLVAVLAVLFTLPDNPDTVAVPATLLWDFRLQSLAAHALLWAVLGAVFGALGLRAGSRAVPAVRPTAPQSTPV
ncbi:CbtA family protein [Streptomyces chiangmaiensis]|uniref:CbtA family protein n=1 Tax=Streptomyces chiangmaiensis TaxID=766497 RepID=A0ABU7FYI3_9ACTN|nr:CbtA family protein [Streptomyces chiangmaiensis]MED7828648.1 CbtA family protein [Streptomyces chiangmaiensis]